MPKWHFSDEWLNGEHGHDKYEFVDINLLKDQKLFIDPCLIANDPDLWSMSAILTINSFFDEFYDAYRKSSLPKKKHILDHAQEINFTKLGYGAGDNGHGNKLEGLLDKFSQLDTLVRRVPSMTFAMDIPVLLPSFAEDGLSDMLTNILHDELNSFTLAQCEKYGIVAEGKQEFNTWDRISKQWISKKRACLLYGTRKILLVPKRIVHKNYLFGTGQYFEQIILTRMQYELASPGDKKRDLIPKAQIKKDFVPYMGEHWKYDFAVSYSSDNLML